MSGTLTGSDWAKQQTLDRIATATERSAGSLASMLVGKTDGFAQLADDAKKAGKTLVQGSKEEQRIRKRLAQIAEDDLKKQLVNAEQRVKNQAKDDKESARSQRERFGQRFNQAGARLTDGSTLLAHTTERITSALQALPVAGAVLGGMLGAVTGLISSVMKSKDTFIDMVDSGIMFGGSLTQFRIGLGNAGLSTEQFAAIVQQSGRGISVLGESRFLESTNRLQGFFDDFGLSINQGNEYFGEYIENARLSGSLYLRTMGEHEQSFKDNMTLMREQARLTGVSVRAQREQQQTLQRDARYQAFLRSRSTQERTYIETQERAMTGAAGEQGAQFSREFFQMAFRGNIEKGGMMQTLMGIGSAAGPLQALAARARGGEQLNPDEFLKFIHDLPREVMDALSLRGGADVERIMAIRQVAEARLRPEGMAAAPTSTLTPETIALNAAQNRITALTAQFNAQITKLGELLIEIVTPALTSLNNTLRAFTSAAPGTGITGGIAAMFRQMAGGSTELPAGVSGPPAPPNALTRIAQSFDQGFFSGVGSLISESFSALMTEFFDKMEAWKNSLLAGLRELIPSWMRESEAQRNANAQLTANAQNITPEDRSAIQRGAPSARVGLGSRYFTDALRNINRIEESVERSGNLTTPQQQELQQQIATLQTIRAGLEAQTDRSRTEQELLQRIADAMDNGNRRLVNAFQER